MVHTEDHGDSAQTRRLQMLLRKYGINADVREMTPEERRIIDSLFPE